MAALPFLRSDRGLAKRTEAFMSTDPLIPTQIAWRFPGGRIKGVDNSVWLVRKMPMAPYVDATSLREQLDTVDPLMRAFEGLAGLANGISKHRITAKASYRRYKLLEVNVPRPFRPDPKSPLYAKHMRDYGGRRIDDRIQLLAVRLIPSAVSRGLRGAIDSTMETALYGGTPMEDFDRDAEEIGSILERAGGVEPTAEELQLADSWWSTSRRSDSHYAVHADHMHVFHSAAGTRLAKGMSDRPCSEWDQIDGHNIITVTSVEDFDLKFQPSTKAYTQWASDALQQGALAISVSGAVEPATITTEEMRRQHTKAQSDIEEMYRSNKLTRHEQQQRMDLLREISQAYEGGGFPTLTDTSVLIAFSGMKDERQLLPYSCATVRVMENRQLPGLSEMQLASNVDMNPNRHELPSAVVACSGMASLNRVGDDSGALLGFDERDSQPAYVSPDAATTADGLPIMLVAGATGSGKATSISTRVITPNGETRMGDLAVGDAVIGRDGKPCTVHSVHEVPTPEHAYRITLSDGQAIEADGNHQWVVSDRDDRTSMRRPKHMAALQRADESRDLAQRLYEQAATYGESDLLTLKELTEAVQKVPGTRITTQLGARAVLEMMDTPRRKKIIQRAREFTGDTVKTDPMHTYGAVEALEALATAWENPGHPRWAKRAARRAVAARKVLATVGAETRWTTREIAQALDDVDPSLEMNQVPRNSAMSVQLHHLGLTHQVEMRPVTLPMGEVDSTWQRECVAYPARRAFTDLATRVLQQIAVDDSPYRERVMSTAEMLSEGVETATGHKNWSIHLPEALDLPEAALPVAPYTLGAWLGDGDTNGGGFTGIDPEIWENIERDGYSVAHRDNGARHYIYDLVGGLREAGFQLQVGVPDKHIPMTYLRASAEQRLAVLQGLMDTDGSISRSGSCELTLCLKPLATDALELIRSLGIKASVSENPAALTETDPATGEKTRRVVGTRYRIKFTTDKPVFRLPRKLALVPTELRETQQWLYVQSIEPVEPTPMRCITVDSPDSTYLIEGMIPTHNTLVGLDLADQYQEMGVPTVFIDPKNHVDGEGHGPTVRAMGGQVASLDDLLQADGVFDAIRVMKGTREGSTGAIQQATELLLQINPWGPDRDRYEVKLTDAIRYGVEECGAVTTGQALQYAYENGILKGYEDIYLKCEDLRKANSQFSAIYGHDPDTESLSTYDGLTLIEVGSTHLPIPEPGQAATMITQRVAMALVRMMVFGSATALTGRSGVVMLDEAWTFLSAGRSEVERLGRLARSQRVLPILLTQRVTDALEAGLAGYISRGIILHISDPDEAKSACDLFKVEATQERLERIMAPDKIGGQTGREGVAGLNAQSLKALIVMKDDPDFPGMKAREVIRGSVAYYADLNHRFIPVECEMSDEFLMMSSTNPIDIARRDRVLSARRVQAAKNRRADRESVAIAQKDGVVDVEDLFGVGDLPEFQPIWSLSDVESGLDESDTPREQEPAPAGVDRGGKAQVVEAEDLFG